MRPDVENPSTPPRTSNDDEIPDLGTSPTLSSLSGGGETKVMIEHNVKSVAGQSRSAAGAAVFFMSKPAMALLGVTAVASMGSAAFLNFFQVPGLKSQIKELEDEVNRLESQVDRLAVEVDALSQENDRYSDLNQQLNLTATEFEVLNQQLNTSTIRFDELNDQLNSSNMVLTELNEQLSLQVQEYSTLNSELNTTALELATLNTELTTVVSFLNDTSNSIQQSFDAMVAFLADQIVASQQILINTLNSQYLQLTQTWDCDYRDYFIGEDFLVNPNAPIDDGTNPLLVPQILDYVDLRVLSNLCLDKDDFELFLVTLVPWEELSSNDIVRAANRYLTVAMQFYFPDDSNPLAIQLEDWADADYQCSQLTRSFVYYDFV